MTFYKLLWPFGKIAVSSSFSASNAIQPVMAIHRYSPYKTNHIYIVVLTGYEG